MASPIDVKPIHDLLSKDMDRKEFLVHVGGVMLAVAGITGLVKKLTDPFGSKSRRPLAPGSYGGSAYGGSVERGAAGRQKALKS